MYLRPAPGAHFIVVQILRQLSKQPVVQSHAITNIHYFPRHEKFRNRGKDILRIEALSDAVFAFAVSLLVASLEVPQTFDELKVIIQGVVPFFATVALLFLFWYQQYMFFRRYALNDFVTILYNFSYLAIILFYLYPLKFLFSILLFSWTGIDLFPKATAHGLTVLRSEDFPDLIVLFSLGYFVIWLILFLMHQRALKKGCKPALNEYETLFTYMERRGAIMNAGIGIAAAVLAVTSPAWLAGLCYLLIPVVLFINKRIFRKQLDKKCGP